MTESAPPLTLSPPPPASPSLFSAREGGRSRAPHPLHDARCTADWGHVTEVITTD